MKVVLTRNLVMDHYYYDIGELAEVVSFDLTETPTFDVIFYGKPGVHTIHMDDFKNLGE